MSIRHSHWLCAELMDELGEDSLIQSWEITTDYVGGQLDPDTGPRTTRYLIARAASVLSLTYSDDNRGTFAVVQAAGVRDHTRVQIWAHTAPRPESES